MKNKITILLVCATLVLSGTIFIPNAIAENVPNWVKNTAGWWATDVISETEFVNAIAYLIKVGIINIESSKSPELIAEMWVNGDINDNEFLANVEHLIEIGSISIPVNSITKTSQLPDWLVNNAGWWAARIFTNSDFSFDPEYVSKGLYPCIELSTDVACFTRTYNSYGFRGAEFEMQKHDIDFRIFVVGGSTTFGAASDDNETWPAHLQQIINEEIADQKIQVINAGMQGAESESEYDLIKNKLSTLDPDLIIMYDGWNDSSKVSIEKTIRNWESVCKLGKSKGFDTIILVQPLASTGNRVATDQEITNRFFNAESYLQKSQQYVDAFEELDKVCTKAADFRRIFDYVQEPIFWDAGHMVSFGNKVIAKNAFSLISSIYFDKTYSVIHNEPEESVVYAVGADLTGKNFDNLNLQNAVFDKADLSNTSFKNTNIDGARFVFANLDNSNLLDRIDLSNVNLTGIDLSNTSLKGKDLSGANLSYVDLSEHALSGANLSDTFLLRTNLSGIDLRSIPLTNADFRYSARSDPKLLDSLLVNNNFDYALLKNINFAGKDLSGSSFHQVKLEGSDMQNTNLIESAFVQVDFTKIKNKSLAGADLSSSSFAHSNLSDVDLSGVIAYRTNFWKANLSGVDFTVISKASTHGSLFIETNLSNSNFEGVTLSPKEIFTTTFKNKAYLKNLQGNDLVENLLGSLPNIHIISIEVNGNDLVLGYIFFTSFTGANLENANFKNADLKFADFYQANLTNADLSGADLRRAFLSNADLSNVNLDGADLQYAIIDNAILSNANLRCVNHPICDSG